jgi:iron complex outermembrane receptor protein
MKKILFILFLVVKVLWGEEIQIKGTVVSAIDKIPLQEANIIVQGSNIGTSTDKNGKFILSGIPKNGYLIVSYIGYEQKILNTDDLISNDNLLIELDKKILNSQTILIQGMSLNKKERTFTYSTIDKSKIIDKYTVQDIPELLSNLPSALFYSESGSGIGYNYLNIRGFDQRRISVSVNGIPQNEPEDHNVYWLDMPDLLANTELIQIQRGAGSGIAGYPAIGGAINLITSNFSSESFVSLNAGIGNYNTRKYSVAASSGLINNTYSIYFSLSNILSTGYRNNSWSDFKSFYFSAVRFDEKLTTQINIFGGLVKDGLAYTGLPKFVINNKDLRKVNHNYWSAENNNYIYESIRRPEEQEQFFQPHFEILNDYKLSDKISLNSAIFGIIGNGYFDYDGSWADTSYFRLTYTNGFSPTQNPSNSLIRAMVENKQFGWLPKISLKHNNGELIVGAELRFHNSIHWGSVIFGSNLPEGISPNYRYYYYEGGKRIMNLFAAENYYLFEDLKLFTEVQLAYNKYEIKNERYVNNNFDIEHLFINPRIALSYKINEFLSSYISISNVSREPRLKNYYDAAESSGGAIPQFKQNSDGSYDFNDPLVKPENMTGIEVGTNLISSNFNFDFNFYYMYFKNEIVANGQLDRFGQPITGNMDKTVHYGLELATTIKDNSGLELIANLNLNKNKIVSGEEYFINSFSGNTEKIDLSGNRIGGFPNIIFNAILNYRYSNLLLQVSGKYHGKAYSDNYDSKLSEYLKIYPLFAEYNDNVIDPFFVVNAQINYKLCFEPILKDITFVLQINNIFNKLYAPYAYGKEFFPAAERNYYLGMKLEF